MSAPFIIPFNHQPTFVSSSPTTYTVPANKYARVTATLNVGAYSVGSNGDSSVIPSLGSESNSQTITVWAKAGDVFTFIKSPANISVTASTSAHYFQAGTSSCQLLLNSNTIAYISATVSASTGPLTGSTVSILGNAEGYLLFEEYNQIS